MVVIVAFQQVYIRPILQNYLGQLFLDWQRGVLKEGPCLILSVPTVAAIDELLDNGLCHGVHTQKMDNRESMIYMVLGIHTGQTFAVFGASIGYNTYHRGF